MRAAAVCLSALACACAGPGRSTAPGLADLPPLAIGAVGTEASELPAIGSQWFPVDGATVAVLAGERSFEAARTRLQDEAAAIEHNQARRSRWPSLRPHARYYQLDGSTQGTTGEFVEVDKQNLTLGVGFVLELDVIESRARALAAHQARRATVLESEAARRATVLSARERLDHLIAAQNEIAIARDAFDQTRSITARERDLEDAGAGLAVDRLRAEAGEAEAEGDVFRAEAAFHGASTRLAELLRIDPRVTLYAPSPGIAAVELIDSEASLEELIEEALAQRPEIAAALLRVDEARERDSGSRDGLWMPQLVVSTDFDAFGFNAGSLDDRENVMIGLEWDLSPERFGRREQTQLGIRKNELALSYQRESVRASVVRNYEIARVSRFSIDTAERRIAAAVTAAKVVGERRKQGAALLVEVLDAQRQVALARKALLDAVLAHNKAQRRLEFALGR